MLLLLIFSHMSLRIIIFALCFLLQIQSIFSQQISVLTCGKGEEIYSTFGHSAIRVLDTANKTDVVYNYGMFEFSDPNFIPKFINGKLDYMLGKESFEDFLFQYELSKRSVSEQVLNLTPTQKQKLLTFLKWNVKEENKYYRYDFLYDNCATKIIQVLEKNCPGIKINFYKDESPKSFRQLIHLYAKNSVPFIDWGMDLGIGVRTDKIATEREYCFLPDYVAKSLDLSKNTEINQNLVILSQPILAGSTNTELGFFENTPVLLGWVLLFLSFGFAHTDSLPSKIYNTLIFALVGLGGILLGYEWFFTEHSVTKFNFNLLWLNPLFLVYAFVWNRPSKLQLQLRKFLRLSIFLVLIAYFVVGQNFHFASVLMMIALFVHLKSIHIFSNSRSFIIRS
jgi:hypothetical protein